MDYTEFLKIIKKAALEAVENTKPSALVFGTVTSAEPLKIKIEQKLTLSTSQLILTDNVTNHKIKLTNEVGSESFYTVNNALVVGDEVIMVRNQGGQKFFVIDKVGK